MYDSRIGRRWNLDIKPVMGLSQYAAFGNNPIFYSDPFGDTTVPRAGGEYNVEIDEKVNSLEFYTSSNNVIKGTQTPVPAETGQLRSFTNDLGTFSARWSTNANGEAVFTGYLNDKGQTLEAAVQELQEFASSWKYKLWRLGKFINDERDKDPLVFDLKLTFSLLTLSATRAVEPAPFSPGYNPSVTTQQALSGLGTLTFTPRTMALVPKYPYYPSIAGTIENTFLMPGQVIDRYGPLGGRWFSTPGTSYGARSIPPGLSPYTRFRVLKPFEVQKSLASPGLFSGQSGFGIQYQSPISADVLIKRKIIAPF